MRRLRDIDVDEHVFLELEPGWYLQPEKINDTFFYSAKYSRGGIRYTLRLCRFYAVVTSNENSKLEVRPYAKANYIKLPNGVHHEAVIDYNIIRLATVDTGKRSILNATHSTVLGSTTSSRRRLANQISTETELRNKRASLGERIFERVKIA